MPTIICIFFLCLLAGCLKPPIVIVNCPKYPETVIVVPKADAGKWREQEIILPICKDVSYVNCDSDRSNCSTSIFDYIQNAVHEVVPKISLISTNIEGSLDGASYIYARIKNDDLTTAYAKWADISCSTLRETERPNPDRIRFCRQEMKRWVEVLNAAGPEYLEKDTDYRRTCIGNYY